MFYKFNRLAQTLVSATQDVAIGRLVTPQAFTATSSETPRIHYEYKPLHGPERPSPRHVSSSSNPLPEQGRYEVPNTTGYRKLMEKQTLFSAEDGKLVWQKLPKDRLLYYGVTGMTTVAFFYTVYGLFLLASPPGN